MTQADLTRAIAIKYELDNLNVNLRAMREALSEIKNHKSDNNLYVKFVATSWPISRDSFKQAVDNEIGNLLAKINELSIEFNNL